MLCKLKETVLLRPGLYVVQSSQSCKSSLRGIYLVRKQMETKSATSVPSAVSALCSFQTLATAGWPGQVTSDGEHELWYRLRDTAPRACQLVGRDDSLARLFLLVGLDLARYI